MSDLHEAASTAESIEAKILIPNSFYITKYIEQGGQNKVYVGKMRYSDSSEIEVCSKSALIEKN
mgnify:CR=1 FL=1